MSEIKPMLLNSLQYEKGMFEEYKDWIAQEKNNGDFVFIHVKDGKIVGIRNRKNMPSFYLYPELKDIRLDIDVGILIGEACVFFGDMDDKAKEEALKMRYRETLPDDYSVFYGGIDRRTHALHKERLKTYPVTLVIFDALKINNDTLVSVPYSKRYDSIAKLKEQPHLKVAKNIENPKEFWENEVIGKNREGLIFKNKKAVYELGARSTQNLKLKNYKDTKVVVDETEENNRGTKIYGKSTIDGKEIDVECQFGSIYDIPSETEVKVRYLDVINNRLIQPHKSNGNKK